MSDGEGSELRVALSMRCGLCDRFEQRVVPWRGNKTTKDSLTFGDCFRWSLARKGIRPLALPKGASALSPELSYSHWV